MAMQKQQNLATPCGLYCVSCRSYIKRGALLGAACRINEVVHGTRAISPDTALRLSRYFGSSEQFWMNLQARYNLEIEKDRLKDRLEKEVRVRAAQ